MFMGLLMFIIFLLDPNNIIQDGFFDCGQLRPEAKFVTLDDLYKQPVNQKRAILLINAKPELVAYDIT